MKILIKILILVCLLSNAPFIKAETPLDFDGDGKSDFAILRSRADGSNFLLDWYIALSTTNSVRHAQWGFGNNTDLPVPADYDGDNRTDIAVWRMSSEPGESVFYILNSSDATVRIEKFGQQFDDVKVTGDYDGDGKADLAVYRATSPGLQNYYIYRGSLNNPNGNLTYVPWGSGFNLYAYRGDFDADGKQDFCIRTGVLFILRRSSDSEVEYIRWGLDNDALAAGDYDGDGRTDFCVRRTNSSNDYEWYILERDGGGTGGAPIIWGRNAVPIDFTFGAGDYDGDGKSDIGVYRLTGNPSNTYFIRRSGDGSMLAYQFGRDGDIPLPIY
jgi:hypothetical protein